MNSVVVSGVVLCAGALVVVPRRWAPLPLITAACYVSLGQFVEVGPFNFTAIRILILVGALRAVCRNERLVGGINGLDWWMIVWSVWACVSSVFPEDPAGALIFRLGLVYNTAGIYFLLRVFCTSVDDVIRLSQATAILLVPLGIEMLYEISGAPSLFYVVEGTVLNLNVREGRVRAVGPFLSPITAGTVGAVCIPLIAAVWKHRSKWSFIGILGCILMVLTSASSGPIVSLLAGLAALAMWPFRYHMRLIRWLAVLVYLSLSLAMKAPVYYLMARIDLAGGSTGWHRARVIESSIEFLDEWWLAGTEYTRHWAPVVGWTPNHTDITSQYLYIGVLGGLPLMLVFILVLVRAFSMVGRAVRDDAGFTRQNQFMLWALGSALFAHAATFLSVSYFDQSFVFLYVVLGAIGSARATNTSPAPVGDVAVRSTGNGIHWTRQASAPSRSVVGPRLNAGAFHRRQHAAQRSSRSRRLLIRSRGQQ